VSGKFYVKDIPDNSKLILLGDMYREPNDDWKIAAYFLSDDKAQFRKAFPISALPFLASGNNFPISDTQPQLSGYPSRCVLPPMDKWQIKTHGEMPYELQRVGQYSEQIEHQIIFSINYENKTYWIPALELARRLHFCSSELVRVAVLEGSTLNLARTNVEGNTGFIDFTDQIPTSYINSLEYRKYFAWLLFKDDAQQSFCSIYGHLNREARTQKNIERWIFNFTPPNLEGCEISGRGFTSKDKQHHYIREIVSIAAIPSPDLQEIIFSHPDDEIALENDNEQLEAGKGREKNRLSDERRLDTEVAPRSSNKHRMLTIKPGGLHFDREIDMKRSPRYFRALPKGQESELDEYQEEEVVSTNQSEATGAAARADFDNLNQQELLNPEEKFKQFMELLEKMERKYVWPIEVETGAVPRCRCKKAHLIDGRPRQYAMAKLQRDSETTICLLEIELDAGESLSTLIFRADHTEITKDQVLEGLMRNSVRWQKKTITENTISRYYLDHPHNAVITEDSAMESWVIRAARKVKLV
jgi:hypothetical protein